MEQWHIVEGPCFYEPIHGWKNERRSVRLHVKNLTSQSAIFLSIFLFICWISVVRRLWNIMAHKSITQTTLLQIGAKDMAQNRRTNLEFETQLFFLCQIQAHLLEGIKGPKLLFVVVSNVIDTTLNDAIFSTGILGQRSLIRVVLLKVPTRQQLLTTS